LRKPARGLVPRLDQVVAVDFKYILVRFQPWVGLDLCFRAGRKSNLPNQLFWKLKSSGLLRHKKQCFFPLISHLLMKIWGDKELIIARTSNVKSNSILIVTSFIQIFHILVKPPKKALSQLIHFLPLWYFYWYLYWYLWQVISVTTTSTYISF
jgi:hypothetical protein